MKFLLVSFFVSTVLCFLLIRFTGFFAYDPCCGVQKFHRRPVPRIGGVAIFVACLISGVSLCTAGKPFCRDFFLVVVSSVPVFVSGVLEDVTKRISPEFRLFFSFISALLFCFLFSVVVRRVDVWFLDFLFSLPIVSFVFTVFAIAGVAHAFNIIDGFNGLCSGIAMMVFGSYAYVAFKLGDMFIVYLSMILIFAILGFFVWNYPMGLIFLGDGGAYFLGFIAAVIGVLLVNRHPQVSPWFPLMLVVYPVWETLFSVYRRRTKRLSPDKPDALHLHSLIFRRLVSLNPITSVYCWFMELLCVVLALAFWKSTPLLMLSALAFVLFYLWIYFRIVRFKTPKILKA